MKFLFDLDGTVTSEETVPLISSHFGVESEIHQLTLETVKGNIPFIESFIRRVNILGNLPVDEVAHLLGNASLYTHVAEFIRLHAEDCAIVTGNLDCWCSMLGERIGCKAYYSEAIVEDNRVKKIKSIWRKEQVVDQYKAVGETVVFIGDGNNDLEAMRHADISIATGLTHKPARSLYSIADYIIFNETALCRQLNQLL